MKRRERDESHAPATSRPASRRRPNYQNLATQAEVIDTKPFAQGTFRDVKRGMYVGGPQNGELCVVKYCKNGSVYEDRFFNEDILAVNRSKEIITAFNRAAIINKTILMNEAQVWHHTHPDGTGGHARALVEPMVDNFTKWNSNTGLVDGSDAMQALSHFSYHHTEGQELLCDLQGGRYESCYVLTDPVIMSRSGGYGVTDLGAHGISNFFAHHKCGKFCSPTWRKEQKPRACFKAVEGTTMSNDTQHGNPMGSKGTGAGPSGMPFFKPPVPRW